MAVRIGMVIVSDGKVFRAESGVESCAREESTAPTQSSWNA
ncbi:hypothetical protein [Paenarthrobacter ureafaciens]|nr:hypothetical protein [Paenarthrobacter ureafaciens]MEC3854279.1 hypothetical protein [Paenarthrobacter ureafaciens]